MSAKSVRVAIIGAGAWGTTLALLAARAGGRVSLWVRDPTEAVSIRANRENVRFLPRVPLPPNIVITSDVEEACDAASLIVFVVPSRSMRLNARLVAPYLGAACVVSAAKGLEASTFLRMTEVLDQELGPGLQGRIGAISGPNLAREIAEGKPAATVIAGSKAVVDQTREALMSPRFRCYSSDDVVGVEVGGALKNVYAIGAGIGDQLEAGDNAKAAFVNRSIVEIARLGTALGARPLTFAGLAGLGDLLATCASSLSRNNRVGRRLAAGEALPHILASMDQVAEGVVTTEVARELSRLRGVEMPIVEQMAAVLFEGRSPSQAIAALMERDAREELEGWA
ncbi:MAG TPA: NAD(P)H-dependent glycerol-3-phosphate dehydrogenase [Thermomicrobiales bacterium]|nr:NAD(P)H-dependent glycerol-3-phosphate dehydrogenase [Thermomicrobiales bacterium]